MERVFAYSIHSWVIVIPGPPSSIQLILFHNREATSSSYFVRPPVIKFSSFSAFYSSELIFFLLLLSSTVPKGGILTFFLFSCLTLFVHINKRIRKGPLWMPRNRGRSFLTVQWLISRNWKTWLQNESLVTDIWWPQLRETPVTDIRDRSLACSFLSFSSLAFSFLRGLLINPYKSNFFKVSMYIICISSNTIGTPSKSRRQPDLLIV